MKTVLPILLLFLAGLLFGCSDNPHTPEENEKTSMNYISDVYFLHGTIIDRDPDCFPCTIEFDYTFDTTRVATTVSVKYLEDNPDSVQLFGLEAANSGRKSAYPQDCTASEVFHDYCAYALYATDLITLDLFRGGYLYQGQGTLEQNEMSLNGLFKYRVDSLGYDFTGQRVKVWVAWVSRSISKPDSIL